MAQASYFNSHFYKQTIGSEYDFKLYSYDSSYLHKVTLKLGSYTLVWNRVKGGVETVYTIPLTWANAIPNATSMNGTLTCETFQSNYSTKIGTRTETVTFAIPSTMKPSISTTIKEAVTGIAEQFGAYVQGKSRITMNITGTGAYGSTIKNYRSIINDVTYTSNSYTTGILKLDSEEDYTTRQWSSNITDSRGKTNGQAGSYKIFSYHNPKINNFSAVRCNQDGTENEEGSFVKVISNASIKPCNNGTENKNTKTFKLSYKLTTEDDWNDIDITGDSYDLSDERILSDFDINSTYNFKLEAIDFFGEENKASKIVNIGTSDNIMDFHHSGNGMAIGKASEEEKVFDIGWATKLTGGLKPFFLEADTDLNDVRTPNFYTGQNISNYNYLNCPLASGTFYLEVVSMGESGQVRQRITVCSKTNSVAYERTYFQGTWGEWRSCFIGEEVLYDNSTGSRETITLSASSSYYSYIEIFYFYGGSYFSSVKVYNPNGKKVNMVGAMVNQSSLAVYLSATTANINGTTIAPTYYGEYTVTSGSWAFTENRIFITRVVGYR